MFEIVIDDYVEVWVDGALPKAFGDTGGNVVSEFNATNRVVLTRDARPGQRFDLAVFGVNGPISASPRNYIWVRSATLDFYTAEHARSSEPAVLDVRRVDERLDGVVPPGTVLERIATGFAFTEGPLWLGEALLFSAPNTNTIYRWTPEGRITVFRPKSGYTGTDIGHYHQPGSNALAADPDGLRRRRGRRPVEPGGARRHHRRTRRGRDRRDQSRPRRQPVRLRAGWRVVYRPRRHAPRAARAPQAPHNLAWGGDVGRTLFITALDSVYRLIRPQPPEGDPDAS